MCCHHKDKHAESVPVLIVPGTGHHKVPTSELSASAIFRRSSKQRDECLNPMRAGEILGYNSFLSVRRMGNIYRNVTLSHRICGWNTQSKDECHNNNNNIYIIIIIRVGITVSSKLNTFLEKSC